MDYIKYFFYSFLIFFSKLLNNNEAYEKYKQKIGQHRFSIKSKHSCSNMRLELDFFKAYMYFKQKYNIDLPIEILGTGNIFILDKIKIGDIKRIWKGEKYSLEEVSPYQYLKTKNKKIYDNYIEMHKDIADKHLIQYATKINEKIEIPWTSDRIDNLLKSLKNNGYNPTTGCICVDNNNVILDGQHRACCLLYLFGKDYEITVCRVKKSL